MLSSALLTAAYLSAAHAKKPTQPMVVPVTPQGSQVLTLETALETAEGHAPDLRAELANLRAVQSRADEARSPLLPQLNVSAIRSWSTFNYAPRPGAVPPNLNRASPTESFLLGNYYSAGATASQVLFDPVNFGRWRVAVSNADAESSNAENERQVIRLNVRTAYFSARAQKSLLQVAKDTLTNEEKHLAQVEGFVQVGTRPEIDLVQEKTARANDAFSVIQADNAYQTAKAQLNQAMGVEAATDYEVQDTQLPPLPDEEKGVDALLAMALDKRPDYASLETQVHAQEMALWAVKGAYLPTLAAQVSGSEAGPQLNSQVWNLSAQLGLSWNLFSGLNTLSQQAEGNALVEQVRARRDSLRLQVRLDVEQAMLAVRAGKSELLAADEALTNAKLRLGLAEGRYQTGVGSVIELGDAQVALTQAAAQKVRSEYDLATSRSQLTKALGRD